MRILDCKDEDCKKLIKGAPVILDYICDDCRAHFENVKSLLTAAGVEYEVDAGIVRGLDYYTKTVFEFVSDNIGAQSTVCGGGRYDGLVEEFGGGKISGVGFAVGIERLLLLMENNGEKIREPEPLTIYLAPMGDKERKEAFGIVSDLRKKGISADTDYMERGIKSQFKYADKIKARFVGVIGEKESENGVVRLKDMASGEEKDVAVSALYDVLKESL